jgi:DNA ligase-1|uniref:Polydeoxyribonucleotide synthase [ATP] n=1 Tax=viral metagenome TaxID=1070528 RepID=A0A6C0ALL5_9ZZZZ
MTADIEVQPIEIKYFEALYEKDAHGKIRSWNLRVEKYEEFSEIIIIYGYKRLIEQRRRLNLGKNLNKSNCTTHFTQAIMEAQSKWTKKVNEGYSTINETNEETKQETTNEKQETTKVIYPMLAQDFNKHKTKLKYPAFIQPKLDGYRCIFNSKDKSCNSRQGKEFSIIKRTELYKELMSIKDDIILDGELYIHKGLFEDLGILRKKKIEKSDIDYLNKIEYHVYDIIVGNIDFDNRFIKLKRLIDTNKFKMIKLVETLQLDSEAMINEYHSNFIKNNYEGSILRNKFGIYKCKIRSTDLLKYKDFQDDEFEIVNFTYEADTSKENKNLIVWICKTTNGDEFNVRPGGTKIERQKIYSDCLDNFKYKGKRLYVKYFELTDRGIPRFPTTKTTCVETYIRDIIE